MALIKNFSLVGVGPKIQLGKGGAKLVQSNNTFQIKTADESAFTTLSIASPTLDDHAVSKGYLDTRFSGVSSARIVDSQVTPLAIVATDEIAGTVTISAKGVSNLATKVVKFTSGLPADSSFVISNDTAGEVSITADSANATANLRLAPKGAAGEVIIGVANAGDSIIAGDDDTTLVVTGGDSTTTGGNLILRGGNGTVTSGIVRIASGNDVAIAEFVTGLTPTNKLQVSNGTANITLSALGTEADINIILAPKGTGTISASNAKITNLLDGVASSDAVTVSQLNSVTSGTASKIGSIQTREITISTASLPIGTVIKGRVRRVMLQILTPYDNGATLSVGKSGALAELVDSDMIDETTAGLYDLNTSIAYATDTQLLATITGGPSTGSAVLIVEYIQA